MLNGAQVGPVTTDELTVLFTAGTLRSDTLVWRQGMASWLPASQVPELASALSAIPAAAPSAAAAPVAAVAPTSPIVTAGTPGAAPLTGEAADIEQNKIFGVISYLGLLFLVPLIAAKQSKFAMYHCNQGAVLFVVAVCCWIAMFVISMILHFIPILGLILSMLLHLGLFVGLAALMIIGIINAVNGKMKPLPLIGTLFTLVK